MKVEYVIISIVAGFLYLGVFFLPPMYAAFQLYLRTTTNSAVKPNATEPIVQFFIWLALMVFLIAIGPFPLFDAPFVVFFGWTVGLWRFFDGFRFEPIAVGIGAVSVVLFFVTLHGLLHGVLKQYGKMWRFGQTARVGGIMLAVSVAGIALLAGIHEIYWVATIREPWVESGLREASKRNGSQNNVKQWTLGMDDYLDVHQTLPYGGTILPDGRLGHGWITQILPYIEYTELYEKIDFDKPWTDPKNEPVFKELVYPTRSPMLRQEPTHNAGGLAPAHYAVNERVLPVGATITVAEITDGTSNTILLGEVNGNFRAWGDPINGRDPALGINKSPYGFGGRYRGVRGTVIGFCDGSARFIQDKIDPGVLRALSTPNGGEEVSRP